MQECTYASAGVCLAQELTCFSRVPRMLTGPHVAAAFRSYGHTQSFIPFVYVVAKSLPSEKPRGICETAGSCDGYGGGGDSCYALTHHRIGHRTSCDLRARFAQFAHGFASRNVPPRRRNPSYFCAPASTSSFRARPRSTCIVQSIAAHRRRGGRIAIHVRSEHALVTKREKTRRASRRFDWVFSSSPFQTNDISSGCPVIQHCISTKPKDSVLK